MPPESLCCGRGIPPSSQHHDSGSTLPELLGPGLTPPLWGEAAVLLHTQTTMLHSVAVGHVSSFLTSLTVFPLEGIGGTRESRLERRQMVFSL